MDAEKVKGQWRRGLRWLLIAAGVIAGLWVILLVTLQIVCSPSFLKKMADRYIPQYVDADVSIGSIRASVLKSFPNLNVALSDFSVTYPHERFAAYDTVGAEGFLRRIGCADKVDTLLSLHDMSLSVNYIAAIAGKIHVHELSMDRPRIFARYFGPEEANWNIMKTSSSQDTTAVSESVADSSSSSLPEIVLNRISMTGHPSVVYTDIADTIFASVLLKQMHFHGKINTSDLSATRLGLKSDSLFISGRLPADTLALFIDHFNIGGRKRKVMSFDIAAKAFAGMNRYGRIVVPIEACGDLSFPHSDATAVSVKNFKASAATVTLTGEGDVRMAQDSTYIKAEASIKDCSINDIIQYLGKNFLPEAANLKTDAVVSMTALCDGWYNPARKSLPELVAEIAVPEAVVSYPGVPDGKVRAHIEAQTDGDGKLDVSVENVCLNFGGLDIDIAGNAYDLVGEDPLFDVEGTATASVDRLMAFLPDSTGYSASGDIDAKLSGKFRMSCLDMDNFYRAELEGYVRSDYLEARSENDTLYAWIGSPVIRLNTLKNNSEGDIPKGAGILAVTAGIDSMYVTYGGDMVVRGAGAELTAHNATMEKGSGQGVAHRPIVGNLSLSELFVNGADSLFMGLVGSKSTVRYSMTSHDGMQTPMLSLTSANDRVFAMEGVNRFGFKDAKFDASAVMTTYEQNRRRDRFLDSLQRVYPGVPRDSLFGKMIRSRMAGRPMPDFMSEADFRSSDISLDLGETVRKYMKEWSLKGGLNISKGLIITPYFPIRNVIEDVRGTMNNDVISLDNVTLRPGASDISATGKLTGLRQLVLGRGLLKLDLKITSEKLDANELLAAYSAGARFTPEEDSSYGNTSDMSDEAYLANVAATGGESSDSTYALIVIPANLVANISLQANEIDYSDLVIDWLAADMMMKERCVQVTNTLATSNMGDIYFEGFYSTKTKKDIKAGFDLSLVDITADKVVQLFPAVDSIMPMLTSFKGMLDCEMAATSDLDTNMNFITSTMNGMMKISGRDVTLEESPEFRKLAKLLMFKNKKVGTVADMSVSGLISDNRLEIFPFIFKIDRYTLAMSGLQNFDQTFKYHVSVLKSPIPFRFGINIFGNFDNWKYRIGKAQYKDTNVPVFTAQIDTMQMNLVSSIHNIFSKGVDLAVRQNEAMRASIDSSKVSLGFNPDAQMDSLDAGERYMLDSLQTSYDSPVDSALNARIDSLSMSVPVVNDTDASKSVISIGDQTDRQSARQERREARRQKREEKKAARSGDAALTDEED